MIELPSNVWYEDEPLRFEPPENWDVTVFRMSGDSAASISREEIIQSLREPVASKPLSKLAEEKREAVIVFDDMTRPTKLDEIARTVIEEIKKGGVSDENIVFVCANGAHGTYDREDFAKKLGEDIVESYPTFNHNCLTNLEYLGDTTAGTPVDINAEVMSYRLKIGLGCIVPHPQFGYGGGAKLVLPGVAGIRSITYNHGVIGGWSAAMSVRELHPTCQMAYGRVNEENILRKDAEEAARMAEFDFIVNTLVNTKRENTHVFAGDIIEAQRKGVEVAKSHYSTQISMDFDVVISNAYSKASESAIATWTSICLKQGGTLVIVCNSKTGQISHYVHGRWGMRKKGGLLYLPPPDTLKKVGKVLFVSEYQEKQPWLEVYDDRVIKVKSMEDVVEEIGREKQRVAVFPDATIQKPF
ncbi:MULTISPECIES: lactate racemase domain-containing protein [unclassified Archaeoglobus]|jgi:nickel-dependent lactate racemase|uniref:lactate racemase domain-containing protein n=1 Tax=unclassified Archaeoglobus TaxID=2643606 RepID=UPI0025B88565|nr:MULTISPECIES: lactate racemase domain-containing protein [unclassified Archaeoglobus]